MHTTRQTGKSSHKTDAALTPDERRHEVATILAAGVLRLTSRLDLVAESADSADADGPGKSSDSAEKALELCTPPSTHCPDG
jgi:hypothetical protein